MTFPQVVHKMLTAVEEQNQEHIVSWQIHGRSFKIYDTKRFVSDVIPQFFNQSKLTSFQRQLNLYGFHRVTSGPDQGAYVSLRGEFVSIDSLLPAT